MIAPRALVGLTLVAGLALGGCRDRHRFDTDENEAFCGSLVGAPFAHHGFWPDDLPPTLGMRVRIDMSNADTVPGALSTDDHERGLCAPDPLLDETPMRAMEEAFHDPLSTLEFGEGREDNLLVWVDTACLGSVVGVVSLMKSGDVEVRLLKPAPAPTEDSPPAERPGFAQFSLSRRQGDCGF